MAWTCSGCLLSVLRFHKCRTDALIEDQEVITSYEFTENTENIVRVLKEQSKNKSNAPKHSMHDVNFQRISPDGETVPDGCNHS